jgi:hypothetical protein
LELDKACEKLKEKGDKIEATDGVPGELSKEFFNVMGRLATLGTADAVGALSGVGTRGWGASDKRARLRLG